jgi:(E)-4-hydroxy-3-methylbut-2-enyl-diphosphate synthase
MKEVSHGALQAFGYSYTPSTDKWNISDQACDYIFAGERQIEFDFPGTLGLLTLSGKDGYVEKISGIRFLERNIHELWKEKFSVGANDVLIITTGQSHGMAEQRRIFIELMRLKSDIPVIIRRSYTTSNIEELALQAATDFGALLIDGFGDGIWIDAPGCDQRKVNQVAFGILQATRKRISKTEYISCPSCGRTLFDLQETTAKIRARTSHLKGVKIGIMGCIVNGPGEMADADYGYVGTGIGKITLYKGKEVVQRNIDAAKAVDALIELIRKNGDWLDPVVV